MMEADSVANGREALSRLRRVGQTTWGDWLLVAQALSVGREHSMKIAETNRPYGPKYYRAMRLWIDANGFDHLEQSERYSCHRLLDNLAAITAWRDSLDEHRRLKNNHPHGVYWSWRRSLGLAPQPRRLLSAQSRPGTAHKTGYRRAVSFSQDTIKRAGQAMREQWCNDVYKLAAIALSAAIRHEADLLELFPASARRTAPQNLQQTMKTSAPAATTFELTA